MLEINSVQVAGEPDGKQESTATCLRKAAMTAKDTTGEAGPGASGVREGTEKIQWDRRKSPPPRP